MSINNVLKMLRKKRTLDFPRQVTKPGHKVEDNWQDQFGYHGTWRHESFGCRSFHFLQNQFVS